MVEVEETNTSEEESLIPEDATTDIFLEDARKAALEEAGIVEENQSNEETESEVKEEEESTPPEQEDAGDSEELDKPFVGSRREAYRLAEERRVQLEESEKKTLQLTNQLEEQKKLDLELSKDVEAALSTEEEYQNLTYRSRSGDKQAGALLSQIDANRAFYGKLQSKASRDISSYFTSELVKNSKEAGLTEEMIFKGTPAEIVKNAFQLGVSKTEAEAKIRIDSLEAELKQAKSTRVTRNLNSQLSGGQSSSGDANSDLFDKDGLPTDEAIQAARSGKLRSFF